jgi:LPXTG-motif cell wall-anchored protein
MGSSLLGKLTVATGAAVVVGLATASPALADTTVAVNPGNVPTTASAYGTHDCDENFGGGPLQGSDVWVFVLPGNQKKVGDFVSVTATFGGNGTLTIPADGGAVVTDKGASKAWITTPAGWTLTGASAVITGTADKFNLTHTCPAGGGGQTATPSPTPSASESSASPGPTGGANGGESGGSTSNGSGPVDDSTGGQSGGLPVTGAAVTGMAMTGAALVAGGIILLVARRRRDALVFTAEGDLPAKGDH